MLNCINEDLCQDAGQEPTDNRISLDNLECIQDSQIEMVKTPSHSGITERSGLQSAISLDENRSS